MRKSVKRTFIGLAIATPLIFTSHILHDVEHTGDNILEHASKLADIAAERMAPWESRYGIAWHLNLSSKVKYTTAVFYPQ